jgi:hypothetical protein
MVDIVGLTINEDGASCELLLGLLFSEGSWEAARQSRHVLVKMDNVARAGCGVVQYAFTCVKNLRGQCRRMISLAQSAGRALWLRARGRIGVVRLNQLTL